MGQAAEKTYFYITYREAREGKVVTLKAQTVTDSSLGLSFVAISNFIFDTNSRVVNPAEEDQKRRFEGVKTLHLSIYSIISIEEIGADHNGLNFKKDKSNLVIFSSESQSPRDK